MTSFDSLKDLLDVAGLHGNSLARTTKLDQRRRRCAPRSCAVRSASAARPLVAIGAVELVHEARGGGVLDGPQRRDDRARAVGEKSVGESEHAFAAQRAAVAGGAARQHHHVGAQAGARDVVGGQAALGSSAPSAAYSLRNSADCSGESWRATAWVAKCSTASVARQCSCSTRAGVASNPRAGSCRRRQARSRTARASSAEYGSRVSLSGRLPVVAAQSAVVACRGESQAAVVAARTPDPKSPRRAVALRPGALRRMHRQRQRWRITEHEAVDQHGGPIGAGSAAPRTARHSAGHRGSPACAFS